jgi:hypothetical protein
MVSYKSSANFVKHFNPTNFNLPSDAVGFFNFIYNNNLPQKYQTISKSSHYQHLLLFHPCSFLTWSLALHIYHQKYSIVVGGHDSRSCFSPWIIYSLSQSIPFALSITMNDNECINQTLHFIVIKDLQCITNKIFHWCSIYFLSSAFSV